MNFVTRFLAIACVFVFMSCNDKLDLNAPYKEMPSIYAVLNPQEQKQVIRVNKVFLGEGDANVMAKVADSVNYQPGEITVSLTRKFYGTPDFDVTPDEPGVKKLKFDEEVVTTAAGAFNTTQRVYTTTKRLFANGEYRLEVRNNKTGNVFTSEISALDSIKLPGISPLAAPYYPVKPGSDPSYYIDYSNQGITYNVRFKPNEAKIYQLRIRVHFFDSIGGSPEKTYQYVDYDFTNQHVITGGYILNSFTGADFFKAIGNSLSRANLKDPTTIAGRKTYKIQYFVFSSTQEYMDYLQYAAPSLNISQSKPLYSNFDGKAALGIFTFRTRFSLVKDIHPYFINEFSRNAVTQPYKFFDSQNQLH